MTLIPIGILRFLKAIDQENFEYFSGKNARGASIYMFDITAGKQSLNDTGALHRVSQLPKKLTLSVENIRFTNKHMTMEETMKKV